MHLQNFISYSLDKTTQPALGKFPTKVKMSMPIFNSVGAKGEYSISRGWHHCTIL
jgi:hypothetical protein